MEKFQFEQNSDHSLSLIKSDPTRWNSVFEMINRILLTKDSICEVLLNKSKVPRTLIADEVLILSELKKILEGFKEAIEKVSGDTYATISLIIPLSFGLFKKLSALRNKLKSTEAKQVCNKLIESIQTRIFPYEARSITRISTILHCQFKKVGFRNESHAEKVCVFLENKMCSVFKKNEHESNTSMNRFQDQSEHEHNLHNQSLLSFLNRRSNERNKSGRSEAIIMKRQYIERPIANPDKDPLLYWKVSLEELSVFFFLNN